MFKFKEKASYLTIQSAMLLIGGGYYLQMEITNTSRRRKRAILFADQPQATWWRPGIRTKSVGAKFSNYEIWEQCTFNGGPIRIIQVNLVETYIKDFNICLFRWYAFWRIRQADTSLVTGQVPIYQGPAVVSVADMSRDVSNGMDFYSFEMDIPPKTTIVITFNWIGNEPAQ